MLTLSDMTAPTPEGKALQLDQYHARQKLYDVFNDLADTVPYEQRFSHPLYQQALAVYEATVTKLEALLGAQAHCGDVDMDLWQLFSDLYKDDNGFRPRFHQTRAQVQEYLTKRQEPASAEF